MAFFSKARGYSQIFDETGGTPKIGTTPKTTPAQHSGGPNSDTIIPAKDGTTMLGLNSAISGCRPHFFCEAGAPTFGVPPKVGFRAAL